MNLLYLAFLLASVTQICRCKDSEVADDISEFFNARASGAVSTTTAHSNNWAVIVCTSRFWFNYRHIANALSIYRTVKRLGIPDSHIILMLADDVACNPRNRYPATVFNNAARKIDLYGGALDGVHDGNVEVDYRGYEVTVENFIRLLTGRHSSEVPKSKRLTTDDKSNILVYMTGHGGNEFLKFQDTEEIGSHDLADAFQQMHEKRRYHEILFIVDTCQANTLYTHLYSPNILASGSSRKGESSYSHHHSSEVGVAVIDRYTYYVLDYMEQNVVSMQSQHTVSQLFDSLSFSKLHSQHGIRTDLFGRRFEDVLITDFFGNVPTLYLTDGVTVGEYSGQVEPLRKCSNIDIDVSDVVLMTTSEVEPVAAVEVEQFLNQMYSYWKIVEGNIFEYLSALRTVSRYSIDYKNGLSRIDLRSHEEAMGESETQLIYFLVSLTLLASPALLA